MGNKNSMKSLVDLEKGLISREIFINEEIYKQELEQIFTHTWLFVDLEIRYQIYKQPETQSAMRRIVSQITGGGRQQYMLTPDRLSQIKMPTLILWTKHNPTTGPSRPNVGSFH